jgi:hypothetical protein
MNPGLSRDRREADRRLAEKLVTYANRPDVLVLALPRGGVPVAYGPRVGRHRWMSLWSASSARHHASRDRGAAAPESCAHRRGGSDGIARHLRGDEENG